ncbi:unnamed protein product [Discosporangium mesarthrocarpum]
MQRHKRSYNFPQVARWFADRSDMILLLFDAHKLDVSDELMEIMSRLVDHQDKVRIVLNKADQIGKAKLMRVYGALMWSVGKVFNNPEVVRVYVGSFWDQPLKHDAHRKLFEADQEALTQELVDLPRLSAVRKINELIKRTRLVRAHACTLSFIREQMPRFGKVKKRQEILNNLQDVLDQVKMRYNLHAADMPGPEILRAKLQSHDFMTFPRLSPNTLRRLENIIDVDIYKVVGEGGGSENVFKFLPQAATEVSSPSWPRRGLLHRAGSSMRGMGSSFFAREHPDRSFDGVQSEAQGIGGVEGVRSPSVVSRRSRAVVDHRSQVDGVGRVDTEGLGFDRTQQGVKAGYRRVWGVVLALVLALAFGVTVVMGLVLAVEHGILSADQLPLGKNLIDLGSKVRSAPLL